MRKFARLYFFARIISGIIKIFLKWNNNHKTGLNSIIKFVLY